MAGLSTRGGAMSHRLPGYLEDLERPMLVPLRQSRPSRMSYYRHYQAILSLARARFFLLECFCRPAVRSHVMHAKFVQ